MVCLQHGAAALISLRGQIRENRGPWLAASGATGHSQAARDGPAPPQKRPSAGFPGKQLETVLREPIERSGVRAAGCAIYANRAPLAAGAGQADTTVAMSTAPPTTIRVVRFDIRSIPKKPPAPSVRRRLKAKRRA